MYEGAPNFPEPDRFWKIVEKYGVTILYTAPDGDSRLHQVGRRVAEKARPQLAAPAGHRRRADQSRGVDVVSQVIGGRAAPSSIPGGRPRPAAS
jgi:predicted cupin superfamily sugar epimerase